MKRLGVKPYDTAKMLHNDEDARLYLLACVEEAGDDAAFIAKALGTIARSRVAMADVATKTGLSRESLYKALSGDRDPSFSTILKVSAALGLRLRFDSGVQLLCESKTQPVEVETSGIDMHTFVVSNRRIPSIRGGLATRATTSREIAYDVVPRHLSVTKEASTAKGLGLSHIYVDFEGPDHIRFPQECGRSASTETSSYALRLQEFVPLSNSALN